MRSHDEACKILLKVEELIKPLSKGPKVWSDHLTKVGTFEYVMVSDYLPLRCVTNVQWLRSARV